MNRSTMFCVALVATLFSCKSSPELVTRSSEPLEKPASAGPPLVESGPSFACRSADWREARRCESVTCAADAVGDACAACVPQIVSCDGAECQAACVACLGPEACVYDGNADIAAGILALRTQDSDVIRIGSPPVTRLFGAAADGSVVVVQLVGGVDGLGQPVGGDVAVLTGESVELWRLPEPDADTSCTDPAVSHKGTYLTRSCGEEAVVWEVATGSIVLRTPIDPALVNVEDRMTGQHARTNPFGGERWLILPAEAGWAVFDLEDGSSRSLGARRDGESKPMDAAVSWDGEHVAVGYADWVDIRRTDEPDVEVSRRRLSAMSAYGWEQDGSLLVNLYGGITRVMPDGTVVEETEVPGILLGFHPTTSGWAAAWQPQYKLDEGLHVQPPFAEQATFLTPFPDELAFPMVWVGGGYRGSIFSDVAVLTGGRYVAGSQHFGVVHFDIAGSYSARRAGNGPIQWLRSDGDKVNVGFPHGPKTVDAATGMISSVDIPPEFAQFPVFHRGDVVVGRRARVVKQFFEDPLQASGTVRIDDGATAELFDTGAARLDAVMVDESGTLHYAAPAGFFVRQKGEAKGKLVRATPSSPASPAADAEEPKRERSFTENMLALGIAMQKMPSARRYSPDGALAVMAANGTATVVRTRDYATVVHEQPAQQCIFGSSETLACVVAKGDATWEVVTTELPSGDELRRAVFADLNALIAAAEEQHGRPVSAAERKQVTEMMTQLFSAYGVVAASADGNFVAVGTSSAGTVVLDLAAGSIWEPESDLVAFVGSRIVSTDGTDLFFRTALPPDDVSPLPMGAELMGR